MNILALIFFALGCGERVVEPSSNFRASIQIPISDSSRSNVYRTTVQLSEVEASSFAELAINNFWWSLIVTINGEALAPVTGGVFPASMSVGEYLRAGENTIEMRFSAPSGESAVVTGGERGEPRVVGGGWRASLEFSPHDGFHSLAFPMVDGEIIPQAMLRQGRTSGTVRFYATLDGVVVQELGSVDVGEDREIVGDGVVWAGDVWGFATGGNALYELGAELVGPNGSVVDRHLYRSGVREVELSEGELHVGGDATSLIGVRVESGWDSLAGELAPIAPLGVNTLEIHGAALRESWLREADELGLPLVVLPRCDGNVNVNVDEVDRNRVKLDSQDSALIESVADNPSVLMWTNEGQEQSIAVLSRSYQKDPLRRLIAGVDLPTRSIAMARNRDPGSYLSSWIVEVTQGPGMGPSSAVFALGMALNQGAIGGVLPLPNTNMRSSWGDALSELGQLNQRVAPDGFRSMSEVRITGLPSSEIVYLEAPLTDTVGAVVGANGTVTLSTWYKGPATVRVGQVTQPISLRPNVWNGFQLHSERIDVNWAGGGQ